MTMFDTLENIYAIFQGLNSNLEKVQYLQKLQSENPPFNINWDNLISYWKTAE